MNKVIWTCWLQGRENAPPSVEKCLSSWEQRNPGWKFRCLDATSIERYVALKHHVDLGRQTITAASLSDILRMLLLQEFGGVWVDATLLCARPLDEWLPGLMAEGFFAFAAPAYDRPVASWFLSAEQDNLLISRWCRRTLEYWTDRTSSDDYFWLHHLFRSMCETDAAAAQAWMRVPKVSALGPLHLLPHILSPRDEALKAVDLTMPVFKLTHRLPEPEALRGSLLEHLLGAGDNDGPPPGSAQHPPPTQAVSPRTFASLKVSTENLGDHIQIIAALRLLWRLGVEPTRFIDRDDEIGSAPGLDDAEAPVGILLNGWFKTNRAEWPPHPKLAPIIHGFHIRLFQCPELLSDASIEFFRRNEPIGCRDVYTERLLHNKGVDAFTSNCLSLTLPRRVEYP
jgi:hypothetical protein